MAFQKQPIQVNFTKGLDTKTDKWQVDASNFLKLDNMVFTTGSRLTKRNGFGTLGVTVNTSTSGTAGTINTQTTGLTGSTFLTTFNGNLTAVGKSLLAYSSGTGTWENKGTLEPVELSVLPLIRSNTNQSQIDTAISSNGLICTVYTDQIPTNLSSSRYMYAVADSVTGQNIIQPTPIPVSSGVVTGSPRVFFLGAYFIIVFTNVISAVNHLQYVAVSTNNPNIVTTNTDIASNYAPATTVAWDGVVVGSHLYLAWNNTSGGQSIKITYLTSTLGLVSPATFSTAGHVTATIMSLCADVSNMASPIIWAAYFDSGGSKGNAFAVNQNLFTVLAPTQIIGSGTILNLTSQASNGVLTFYYEISNNYSYDSSIPTHYVSQNSLTQSGTVGSSSILVRSIGLASKAFNVGGTFYFIGIYSSQYQPTYFLFNAQGQVVSRFAYQNAGGYYTVGLPSVTVNDNIAQVGYFFKDFLESINVAGSQNVPNIYSQTGLNLITLTIGTSNVVPCEIAQALHLSGGFLWEYDGYSPVEHNFFLYPDNVEGTPANSSGSMVAQEYQYQVVYTWTDNQGNIHYSAPSIPTIVDMSTNNKAFTQPTPLVPTGTGSSGASTIVVSSGTGLAVGQIITDTANPSYIQPGTYITEIVGTTLTLSQPLAGSPSSDALSISSICSVTLNIPTLRLTYKLANPVKIQIFRWSTAQEEFFQVTTINQPIINNVTVDSISFVDTIADNQILGNSLIYTTGGVLENIGAPSFNSMTLWDNRLWGIDAEDPNLLWESKQVIEKVPVEMSDLLTTYVAPTIASQGSTGPMKCIAPMDDKFIIFKSNAIYYINGTGPDNTGANSTYSQPLFLTSVVGCMNQQSIVFMPNGLMFQSDKGIWLLGRNLAVDYIGAPVESYTINALVTSAVSVPETTQVRFTLDSGTTLVYDYFYQQWATFSGVSAISSTLYQGLHTLLSPAELVYQETPGFYLDGSNPVLMSFNTAWIHLAGLQGYQRSYFFYLLGQYLTPHFLQIGIAYDYNDSPLQSVTITPNNYSSVYGGISPYGQQINGALPIDNPYGGPGNVEQWRVFLQKQRCESFQLQLQEIYDSSFGVPAGPGLYISGLTLLVAVARGFRSFEANQTAGNQNSGGNQ